MERKLATIAKIENIEPIEGADNIVVSTIRGWKVVTKKGEFSTGDLCVFIEIDPMLPIRPEFEFLRKSCYTKMYDGTEGFRIKTVRLRKQISQGIAFPLSILESAGWKFDYTPEGMEVTSILNIVKYQPYIPAQLAGTVLGPLPSFFPRSDEERIQNLPWVLEKYKDKLFYVSEKLNGSSSSFYFKDNHFGVCSRNLELKETEDNSFWKVARQMGIEEKLCFYGKNITIQGELVGEGIQKNPYKIKGQTIFFFNAYDIDAGKYLNYGDFLYLMSTLMLSVVPICSTEYILPATMEEILEYANAPSVLNPNQMREGVVIRPLEEIYDSNMPYSGRLSFKVISNKFLLKHEE